MTASNLCTHVFVLHIPTMIIMLHQQLASPVGTNSIELMNTNLEDLKMCLRLLVLSLVMWTVDSLVMYWLAAILGLPFFHVN